MKDEVRRPDAQATASSATAPTCQSIDWYSEGESRTVAVDGIRLVVRFVGRKGRRARIAIQAPPGAEFRVNE